jgi:arylsulfatase A-like enzyme
MKLTVLTAALVSLVLSSFAAEAPRPNLVFFLIDDLGYADCGFNGGKEIKTPHIDALAEGGAVLESTRWCVPRRSGVCR